MKTGKRRRDVICFDRRGWAVSATDPPAARRAERRGAGRYFEAERVLVLNYPVPAAPERYRDLLAGPLGDRVREARRRAEHLLLTFDASGTLVATAGPGAAALLCDAEEAGLLERPPGRPSGLWVRSLCVLILGRTVPGADRRERRLLRDPAVRERLTRIARRAILLSDPEAGLDRGGAGADREAARERALGIRLGREAARQLARLDAASRWAALTHAKEFLNGEIRIAAAAAPAPRRDPLAPVLRALPRAAALDAAAPRGELAVARAVMAGLAALGTAGSDDRSR